MSEEVFNLLKIKIIFVGEVTTNILKFFTDSELKNSRCINLLSVANENSETEIKNFIFDSDWIFVISDIKDLKIAEKIEKLAKCFIVNLFLFSTEENTKIKEIEKNFGTAIILPENRISKIGLSKNELIYQIINMTIRMSCKIYNGIVIGLRDFQKINTAMNNSGIAYIGISEDIGENGMLEAVKKSIISPLMLEKIEKAKNIFVSFIGSTNDGSINFDEMIKVIKFIEKISDAEIVMQMNEVEKCIGVKVLVIATNFNKKIPERVKIKNKKNNSGIIDIPDWLRLK